MTRRNATLAVALALGALLPLACDRALAGSEYENLGDDGLTEGLDDLLGGGRPGPTEQGPAPEGDPSKWMPDQDLLNDLIEESLEGRPTGPDLGGEDIGQPSNPLARVERNMGQARRLIERLDQSGETGRVQQQVVNDLEALIKQMEKQCSGGQCNSPSQAKQESQRSKPTQSAGKPSAQPRSSNAAQQSTPRLGSSPAGAAQRRPTDELMKEAWGHLPARLREQMLQSSSSEFLPKYREEIERYYQRLADEEAGSAARP